MKRAARAGGLLVAMTLLAVVLAQGWTVQTVAVRDLRQARAIAADLRRLGFDAYDEFAMGRDALQWVRVRVGCFAARDDAEAIAELLRRSATRDAVVVERTPGAPSVGCVEREVGFVAPRNWQQRTPGVAAFEVEVTGVAGLIRYQGGRWQVLQAPATEALGDRIEASGGFVQVDSPAGPFVQALTGDGARYLCAGTLLAPTADAAIVELDGVISACRLTVPDVGDAP